MQPQFRMHAFDHTVYTDGEIACTHMRTNTCKGLFIEAHRNTMKCCSVIRWTPAVLGNSYAQQQSVGVLLFVLPSDYNDLLCSILYVRHLTIIPTLCRSIRLLCPAEMCPSASRDVCHSAKHTQALSLSHY